MNEIGCFVDFIIKSLLKGKRGWFVLVCPSYVYIYISLQTLLSLSKRTRAETVLNAYLDSFLTVAQVARTSKWVKDTMKYETGEWNNHELFAPFINFSAYWPYSNI